MLSQVDATMGEESGFRLHISLSKEAFPRTLHQAVIGQGCVVCPSGASHCLTPAGIWPWTTLGFLLSSHVGEEWVSKRQVGGR